MSIHRNHVVHVDPTNPRDILAAHPSTNEGRSHGCITVAHGIDFSHGGQYLNARAAQSVCVPAGQEMAVLAKLGDVLLGLSEDRHDGVVVTTLAELGRLRDGIVSRHGDPAALDDFFDQLTVRATSR